MSLSVSSFPEAPPPKLVRQQKWQVTPSLRSSGRFLGTLLSKHSVPFLKGIGHFAKTHVKGSVVRQRTTVSRSRWIFKHHSSLPRSSIRSSSIVIDITPISDNDTHFSARSSDVDSSSLDHTIETSLSSTAASSSPTAAKDLPAIPPTDSVKVPHQSSVQSLVVDSVYSDKTVVPDPAKEHGEVASNSEPRNLQPPNPETTTPLPISPSPTTQSLTVPVPSTKRRRRSHSVSAGVKASARETEPPTRPRYKSETAIGLRRLATITPSEPIPQFPATGSIHTSSDSTPVKKQRQQRRETIFKRVRARSAGASGKSTGDNKATESPPLSARMFNMRSLGSRLSVNSLSHHRPSTVPPPPRQTFSSSATALVPVPILSPEQIDLLLQAPPHLRPNTTSNVTASPRSHSPPSESPVVGPGPSDDPSEQFPLPSSSVDRGLWLRLAAVPHAESWDGEQQRRRPRTAPEAVLRAW